MCYVVGYASVSGIKLVWQRAASASVASVHVLRHGVVGDCNIPEQLIKVLRDVAAPYDVALAACTRSQSGSECGGAGGVTGLVVGQSAVASGTSAVLAKLLRHRSTGVPASSNSVSRCK